MKLTGKIKGEIITKKVYGSYPRKLGYTQVQYIDEHKRIIPIFNLYRVTSRSFTWYNNNRTSDHLNTIAQAKKYAADNIKSLIDVNQEKVKDGFEVNFKVNTDVTP